jgi:hypothetical protein
VLYCAISFLLMFKQVQQGLFHVELLYLNNLFVKFFVLYFILFSKMFKKSHIEF